MSSRKSRAENGQAKGPHASKQIIERLKEATCQAEEDVALALMECNGDENEAMIRLIENPFCAVKGKKDKQRRKEEERKAVGTKVVEARRQSGGGRSRGQDRGGVYTSKPPPAARAPPNDLLTVPGDSVVPAVSAASDSLQQPNAVSVQPNKLPGPSLASPAAVASRPAGTTMADLFKRGPAQAAAAAPAAVLPVTASTPSAVTEQPPEALPDPLVSTAPAPSTVPPPTVNGISAMTTNIDVLGPNDIAVPPPLVQQVPTTALPPSHDLDMSIPPPSPRLTPTSLGHAVPNAWGVKQAATVPTQQQQQQSALGNSLLSALSGSANALSAQDASALMSTSLGSSLQGAPPPANLARGPMDSKPGVLFPRTQGEGLALTDTDRDLQVEFGAFSLNEPSGSLGLASSLGLDRSGTDLQPGSSQLGTTSTLGLDATAQVRPVQSAASAASTGMMGAFATKPGAGAMSGNDYAQAYGGYKQQPGVNASAAVSAALGVGGNSVSNSQYGALQYSNLYGQYGNQYAEAGTSQQEGGAGMGALNVDSHKSSAAGQLQQSVAVGQLQQGAYGSQYASQYSEHYATQGRALPQYTHGTPAAAAGQYGGYAGYPAAQPAAAAGSATQYSMSQGGGNAQYGTAPTSASGQYGGATAGATQGPSQYAASQPNTTAATKSEYAAASAAQNATARYVQHPASQAPSQSSTQPAVNAAPAGTSASAVTSSSTADTLGLQQAQAGYSSQQPSQMPYSHVPYGAAYAPYLSNMHAPTPQGYYGVPGANPYASTYGSPQVPSNAAYMQSSHYGGYQSAAATPPGGYSHQGGVAYNQRGTQGQNYTQSGRGATYGKQSDKQHEVSAGYGAQMNPSAAAPMGAQAGYGNYGGYGGYTSAQAAAYQSNPYQGYMAGGAYHAAGAAGYTGTHTGAPGTSTQNAYGKLGQ